MAEFFEVVKAYQTLAAAGMSILAAVLFGPYIGGRIAERHVRSREIWMRRLNFTADLHELAVEVASAPDPDGPDVLGKSPERDLVYKRCLATYSKARVLYPEEMDEDVIFLLLAAPRLEASTAVDLLSVIARYLEARNKPTPRWAFVSILIKLVSLGPEIIRHLKTKHAPQEDPSEKKFLGQTQESFGALAERLTWNIRRYAVVRPLRWKWWLQTERDVHRGKKALARQKRAASAPSAR